MSLNYKKTIISILSCCFIFSAFSLAEAQGKKLRHAPDTLPGVEPEMLTPEYWISLQKDADAIIMTPEQIAAFNERVRNKRVAFRDYFGKPDPLEKDFALNLTQGPVMNPLLPLDMPETLPGDSLRVRLRSNIEWLYSRDFYDNRNAIYNDAMRRDIVEAMNVEAIPDVIVRRFGIIVNQVNIRHYPTPVPGYSDTEWELDFFQATGTCLGNPVAVLHQSKDGDYYYVESPISRGWIAAEDIAIADRKAVRSLTSDKNFIMATGNKIPVYGDQSYTGFARYLYFSATMPLIRKSNAGYIVKMPNRMPNGSLGVTNGYIKADADVHIGYLPYTKRNVITQMFKLLNQPYGWHDQDKKRSCAGTMRVLLSCFGIITGRAPSFILSAADHQFYMNPGLTVQEKIAEAEKLEPIITMAGNSFHIVLFLGKAKNGKLYFMHQAGWGYDEENGNHIIVNRETVNWVEHKWYDINQPNVFSTFR